MVSPSPLITSDSTHQKWSQWRPVNLGSRVESQKAGLNRNFSWLMVNLEAEALYKGEAIQRKVELAWTKVTANNYFTAYNKYDWTSEVSCIKRGCLAIPIVMASHYVSEEEGFEFVNDSSRKKNFKKERDPISNVNFWSFQISVNPGQQLYGI